MGKTNKGAKTGSAGMKKQGFNPQLKKNLTEGRKAKDQKHILTDDRFSKIATDPRFRGIPVQEKKVEIDQRFQSMFTDKSFNQKHTVDKRGRTINTATSENLQKFYHIPASTSKSDDKKKKKNADEPKSDASASTDSSGSEDDDEDPTRDLARGKGNVESSSEDSDSDEEYALDTKGEVEHPWAELTHDAEATEEITRRLALVNMDWDNLRSDDIFALLSSFKPIAGFIKSVKIYPSEFGLQRMKEEQWKGPAELSRAEENVEDDGEKEVVEEGSKQGNEKLRRYQMNRLKYYYAVIECDSADTANKVYEECDGLEYENSSAAIDLRFIPDDMEFEHEPKSVTTNLPANFTPNEFVISALQQSRVRCSWDETPRDRLALTALDWTKADDMQAYLASSSGEEEVSDVEENNVETRSIWSTKDPEAIGKYRALILEINDKTKPKKKGLGDSDDDSDVDMEVSWEPGLKTTTEVSLKEKQKKASIEALTPFEKLLEKQKEKRRAKKQLKKDATPDSEQEEAGEDSESDDLAGSTDENSADEQDDYKDKKEESDDEDLKETNKANLELLMGDSDGKQHFNLKRLINDAKDSKTQRKKKRKLAISEDVVPDNFEMDVGDPRFSALYTSSHYNVDLSDPSFKKTKGMDAVIGEKLRRKQYVNSIEPSCSKDTGTKLRPELAVLAKSVKAKIASNLRKKQ